MMHIGLAIYGHLDQPSGGYRYDRKFVSYCRQQGDTVDVISLPERSYPRAVLDGLSGQIRSQLDRPVEVLLGDGLCHPALFYHTKHLTRPETVVALVHHIRSDDPTRRFARLSRTIERRYLQSVDAAIATSAFLRDRVAALAPAAKPRLVAPPAGRNEGSALSDNEVIQRAHEKPLKIVFIGNFLPRKDPQTLLSAVSRLDCEWELTIVGSHEANEAYANRTVELAATLGVADRVTFPGVVSDDRLESVLADSHVCCVPSRYEAFGMVYLEAMEYGVVPIATTNGGPREFISDGRSGFLVTPGTDQRIAARLDWLETNRDELAAMATEALETARRHPTWTEAFTRIRSFLANCVGTT